MSCKKQANLAYFNRLYFIWQKCKVISFTRILTVLKKIYNEALWKMLAHEATIKETFLTLTFNGIFPMCFNIDAIYKLNKICNYFWQFDTFVFALFC